MRIKKEKKEFTIKSFYYDNINGYVKHNKKNVTKMPLYAGDITVRIML